MSKPELRQTLHNFMFFAMMVSYLEIVVNIISFQGMSIKFLYVIIFAIGAGAFITLLTSLFPVTVNKIIAWTISAFLVVYYCVQYIYRCIFGSFMEIYLIGMGGEAITNFTKETIDVILHNLIIIILMALPLLVLAVLLKLKYVKLERNKIRFTVTEAGVIAVYHILCVLSLRLGGTGAYTVYSNYHDVNTVTEVSIHSLGVLTTARIELKFMLLGIEAEESVDAVPILSHTVTDNKIQELVEKVLRANKRGESGTAVDIDTESQTEPVKLTSDEYNIMDAIDFDYLNTLTDDESLIALNNYFAAQTGTKKNKYTGLFKGYNLIEICAESFSPYVISKEYTPNLYKLQNEGIIFNNFYNSFPNTTTNGEYALCMGLFPDLSRNKSDGSFKYSSNNYLPFSLGNRFDSIGVPSFAYHNYLGTYYSRVTSHPNMGYSFKSMGDGMTFSTNWPTSDLEMAEQSVWDYMKLDSFNTYYMTFSGHYQYSFELNPMCERNKDAVEDMDASTAIKAYTACMIEFDKAIGYMLDSLDKAGKLDNTVIVITNDHYPYGLSDDEYNELAGKEVDTSFEKYKNSFICWTNSLDENIYVDEYCCTVDILPTLLNLFGIEYDSRLLAGKDVLSDSEKMVILNNQSFITDLLKLDTTENKVTYSVDKTLIPSWYIDDKIDSIKNKLNFSTAILNKDYYKFVFANTYPELFPPEGTGTEIAAETEADPD